MEVNCSAGIYIRQPGEERQAQQIEVELKWNLGLDEGDKEKLLERPDITRNATVAIEQDGRKFDWWTTVEKYGPGSLWIATGSGRDSLSLVVQYTVATGSRYLGENRNISLNCRDENLKINERAGTRLYSENTRRGTSGLYNVVDKGTKMKMTLSLRECEIKEKEVECSLNVVT